MDIIITPNQSDWTEFETLEWQKADTEHYGRPLDWQKKHFVLQAQQEAVTMGVLRMEIEVGVCFIETLIVGEQYRGQMVGTNLLQRAEQLASENGAHKVYLNTGKNWDAVVFYRSLGYQVTTELPDHYFHVDFVMMTKFL